MLVTFLACTVSPGISYAAKKVKDPYNRKRPTVAQMLRWNKKWANRPFPAENGVQPAVKELKVFKTGGSYPDCSPVNNLIVYTQETEGGTYEIGTIKTDGTGFKCLTCNKPGAPAGAKGQPFWHPSGDYILFHAANEHAGKRRGEVPGLGLNYDIWIMTADGNRYWRITKYPANWAVNRAMFSPDGRILHWDEEYSMEKYPGTGSLWAWDNPIGEEGGLWRTKLADITLGPDGPKLSNEKILYHQGLELMEPDGFSPDGKRLVFTAANLKESEGHAWFGDIYTSDIDGRNRVRLTNTPLYHHDENAEFTPDGKKIAWSVCSWLGWTFINNQELYLMDADGSDKKRMTYFTEPGHPHYLGVKHVAVGESTWSPDGKTLILTVIYGKKDTWPGVKTRLYKMVLE